MAGTPKKDDLPVEGNHDFPARPEPEELVNMLNAYRVEAMMARDSGENPRTLVWDQNIDRYWGRYDMSKKASWQSRLVLPEVPQYVDRWASAMRQALDASDDFFTVDDDARTGTIEPLIPHITRVMKVLLARCSRTPDGHFASFSSLFEEQMKLGAMMMMAASVTWKKDLRGGWVAVETVDPREVWYDPKGRNLYRRRRYEIDKHELISMASATDEFGLPIYNMDEVAQLGSQIDELSQTNRDRMTGGNSQVGNTGRETILIDEWIATIVMPDGTIAADKSLMIEANEKFLIRGPEANPYWHQQDWLVTTPMVTVPLSVYGRTYMEEWAPTADAFIEMTNLILDATQTSAIKAFVAQASMLADPTQLAEGIAPNTVFQLDEGVPVADFLKEIDLGTLPQEAVAVWTSLKNELREGAKLSEIALGQMPGKSRITAEEIGQVQSNSSSMIQSMAKTIEERWLEPVLTLVWQTALQFMNFDEIAEEIGEETAAMLTAQRAEFQKRRIKFRVRGISGLIDRQTKLASFMKFVQVVSQNPALLQAFMQKTNFPKLLNTLLVWLGVDPASFEYTQNELMQQKLQALLQPPQPAPGAPGQPQQQPAPAQQQPAPQPRAQ